MSKEVDENSGTMRVEFILENQNQTLQAGLSGEVRIKLSEAEQFLLIPANALSVREGKSSVVLVDEHQKIKFQEVVTGRIRGNNVEILSGLDIKNNVVINPNALLSPGQRVKMVLITT